MNCKILIINIISLNCEVYVTYPETTNVSNVDYDKFIRLSNNISTSWILLHQSSYFLRLLNWSDRLGLELAGVSLRLDSSGFSSKSLSPVYQTRHGPKTKKKINNQNMQQNIRKLFCHSIVCQILKVAQCFWYNF